MIHVDVAADDLATPSELAAVEDAFRRAGFEVDAQATVGRKSGGPLPWVLYVTLTTPILAFFTAFGAEAGKDAYAAVKQWAKDLWVARQDAGNGTGSIVVRDPEHTNLVLTSIIPEEALDALRDLDWSEVQGDYVIWNEKVGAWREPMKNPEGF